MENPNTIKPTYSVIVLLYNRTPELLEMAKRCVSSVKASSQDYELIIVDNGSTERYDWALEANTYIRFDKNMGISHGWNTGLKVSRGKYKVIIGDDTEVSPNWLPKLAECFTKPNCGVANPYVEHLPMGIGIKEDYKWFSGACFMLTQETIDKVGYFDEDTFFPTDYEDTDYWLRCFKAGFKLYKNFSVKVKHLEGQTTKASDLNEAKKYPKEAFMKKWGFNHVPYFCGTEDLYTFLGIH